MFVAPTICCQLRTGMRGCTVGEGILDPHVELELAGEDPPHG
jgi:hypothetical protein